MKYIQEKHTLYDAQRHNSPKKGFMNLYVPLALVMVSITNKQDQQLSLRYKFLSIGGVSLKL